jgi:hypothetical protein
VRRLLVVLVGMFVVRGTSLSFTGGAELPEEVKLVKHATRVHKAN